MVKRKKAKAATRAKAKAPAKKGRKLKERSLKTVRGGALRAPVEGRLAGDLDIFT